MDPIAQINPKKDSTFALMLEAQKRHWNIFYLPHNELYLDNKKVMGKCISIQLHDQPTDFFTFLASSLSSISLCEFDIVLMRKDPPFDKQFLYTTYLLDIAKHQGAFIVNDPTAIRDANEKLFTAWFPQCCPEMLVTSKIEPLIQFLHQHQKIIIKPLSHMGGHGVIMLTPDNPNIYSSIELLTKQGQNTIMAQRYIPEILQGDKRVLMIDGEPYPYVLARIPKPGDIRGNLSAGARSVAQPLSEHDRWIANEVGPTLKQKGLYFVGLDIIGDYLTEINVTSPTCIREIESAYQVNICQLIWDKIEAKIKT